MIAPSNQPVTAGGVCDLGGQDEFAFPLWGQDHHGHVGRNCHAGRGPGPAGRCRNECARPGQRLPAAGWRDLRLRVPGDAGALERPCGPHRELPSVASDRRPSGAHRGRAASGAPPTYHPRHRVDAAEQRDETRPSRATRWSTRRRAPSRRAAPSPPGTRRRRTPPSLRPAPRPRTLRRSRTTSRRPSPSHPRTSRLLRMPRPTRAAKQPNQPTTESVTPAQKHRRLGRQHPPRRRPTRRSTGRRSSGPGALATPPTARRPGPSPRPSTRRPRPRPPGTRHRLTSPQFVRKPRLATRRPRVTRSRRDAVSMVPMPTRAHRAPT